MTTCVGTPCGGAEQSDATPASQNVIDVLGQRLVDQLGQTCKTAYDGLITGQRAAGFSAGVAAATIQPNVAPLVAIAAAMRAVASGQRQRKSADQAQGTTAAIVSELSFVLTQGRWRIEYDLAYVTSSASAGLQVSLSFGGTASSVLYTLSEATAAGTFVSQSAAALDTFVGANGVGPGATSMPARLVASVVVAPAGAGTLRLNMKSTGSSATATIQAGSSGGAFSLD